MRSNPRLLWFIFIACSIGGRAAQLPGAVMTIEAGSQDRVQCIVTFAMPEALRNATALADGEGKRLDLQVDAQGQAWFVEPALRSGQHKTYKVLLDQAKGLLRAQVQSTRENSRVRLQPEGLPAVYYQAEPGPLPRADIKDVFRRGAYLHPLRTPSGRLVSDDYPPNHLHHHGLWFSWTKTEFKNLKPDFWNMGQSQGTVEFAGLDNTWNGPVHGGLKARHRFRELISPQTETVLNETFELRAFRSLGPQVHLSVFDLDSTQLCATDVPLILPTYHYGGIGFRGHWDWNGAGNTTWLTSEGERDPLKGHATRGRWCYIGGKVDGQPAGIAILCHPSNFRAPQPMRLHPTEPFFCFAPQQLGAMEISPGKPYVSKYRMLIMDGPPDQAVIDRAYNDYAEPPKVRLEVKP